MSIVRHYCTYFDQRYLPRGLSLYQSLNQNIREFTLWALCFDDTSYHRIIDLNLKNFKPISSEEFLQNDQQLSGAKENRSLVEFYFTCTPSLPLFIFNKNHFIDQITYLDADLFFFKNPEPIFNEIKDASIAIIPHQFPRKMKHLEENGIFNVGWLFFKRDDESLQCISRWRNQCIDWCFDRIEGTRFADQGYLNDWPNLYKNISIIKQKGANLAPWNINQYKLSSNENGIWVDKDPLIFFHFQSLSRIRPRVYKLNFGKYKALPSHFIKKNIYGPYLKTLEENFKEELTGFNDHLRNPNDGQEFTRKIYGRTNQDKLKRNINIFKDFLRGEYFLL